MGLIGLIFYPRKQRNLFHAKALNQHLQSQEKEKIVVVTLSVAKGPSTDFQQIFR